jgi:tellurite resistance protein TerC
MVTPTKDIDPLPVPDLKAILEKRGSMAEIWIWVIFNLFVILTLGFDLFFHRRAHVISMKEATRWSLFWIATALLFNFYIYLIKGKAAALNFLSVDNLFVFLMLFDYFQTPRNLLHKVLFWGVFGAIVMRGIFIWVGIILIQKFHWMIYLFGVFLIFSGVRLFSRKEKKIEPEENFIIRLFRQYVPVTSRYKGESFFVKIDQRYFATPLFIVLLAIEMSDLIFALDSIPAIIAITSDPLIVYTSNVFAILGLRSLFFALSGMLNLFSYLHEGLALILVLIGIKMLLSSVVNVPIFLVLIVVLVILAVSILLSYATG